MTNAQAASSADCGTQNTACLPVQALIAAGVSDDANVRFTVQPLPGEIEVLCVTVEGREELPVFLSRTDEQILCIAYLFEESEIKQDATAEMHKAMLTANVSVPLSSFGIIDNRYVIFGALAAHSSVEEIVHEIETLADNAYDALSSMQDYLA